MSSSIPTAGDVSNDVRPSGGSSQSLVDRPIEYIYHALEDERYWEAFLECMRVRLRLTAATFSVTYFRHNVYSVSHYVGLSQDDFQKYLDKWVSRNPWRNRFLSRQFPIGLLVTSQELTSDEELMADECWRAFLAPRGMHYGFHAVLARDDCQFSSIHAARPAYLGTLSQPEMDWIQALLPHLVRAVSIHGRMARLQAEREALLAYFHTMQIGVILVNQAGDIRFANGPAEAIVAKREALVRRDGRLIAVNDADQRRLEALILGACIPLPGEGPNAGTISLSRPALAPLLVHVAPADSRMRIPVSGGVSEAVVWIIDPAGHSNFNLALLKETFKLTASEARLCEELAHGYSVREVADRLNVSIPTIRTHLAHALEKTVTHRQSELMTVILRVASIPQLPKN